MKVRIIPMNHDKEFAGRTIENIQNDFFLGEEMPLSANGNCRCYHDTYGLQEVDEGDLLIFQMDASIIASAELSGIPIKSDDPNYKAEYLLKKDSIKVFYPILENELKEHCPGFPRFGQGKLKLTDYGLDVEWLLKRINNI